MEAEMSAAVRRSASQSQVRSRSNRQPDAAASTRAPLAFVEPLEVRALMNGALQVSVNFQPSGATIPPGFVADVGNQFGDRGNGFSYGWDHTNTRYARLRTGAAPGPEYLSHQDMYRSGAGKRWELAVPNGTYRVHVVAGDPR